MTFDEATRKTERLNKLVGVSARVVRILPPANDVVRQGDNGWDVEVQVHDDQFPSRYPDPDLSVEQATQGIFIPPED